MPSGPGALPAAQGTASMGGAALARFSHRMQHVLFMAAQAGQLAAAHHADQA